MPRRSHVKVSVVGAVKNPGTYQVIDNQWDTTLGLVSVVVDAGLAKVDFNKPIEIQRDTVTLKVGSLTSLTSQLRGAPAQLSGVTLQEGDVIKVPINWGLVRVSGMGVTESEIALSEGGALSLKEVMKRANYQPAPLKGTRPEILVWRDGEKSKLDLSALKDDAPDILLHDTDNVYVSMEILEHVLVVGSVTKGGSFYFPAGENPSIAQAIQLSGGLDSKRPDEVITLLHFTKDGEGKLRASVAAKFEVSRASDDPNWQQAVQDSDIMFVTSKNSKLPDSWLKLTSPAK